MQLAKRIVLARAGQRLRRHGHRHGVAGEHALQIAAGGGRQIRAAPLRLRGMERVAVLWSCANDNLLMSAEVVCVAGRGRVLVAGNWRRFGVQAECIWSA